MYIYLLTYLYELNVSLGYTLLLRRYDLKYKFLY